MSNKYLFLFAPLVLILLNPSGHNCMAQSIYIRNDVSEKSAVFGNEKMSFKLDYNKKANISKLTIKGRNMLGDRGGIYSFIRTKKTTYSALKLISNPVINISNNQLSLTNIKYGDKDLTISESWRFFIMKDDIKFELDRTMSKSTVAEKAASPIMIFKDMDTWEGAYMDYGGLAWFYLFNKKQDTYGVHSSSSQFWNSKTGDGLSIKVDAPGKKIAMDYSRTMDNKMAYTITSASSEITPRFDSLTHRRRYVRDTTDIWAAINIPSGKSTQSILFSTFDFNEKYGRGHLAGINQEQVSGVLNTIARIGVIDKQHFGGNSWHTPYGPICLHEQYIAQIGLGINDPAYIKGYKECLDYYRDNAIKPDGRVWPRWAYSNEDAMPKGYTDKGFYEAQWGYLLDANPDFVTNVAELYDQSGDLTWVKSHQKACENALEWIMKRDDNHNGLVEMMTDSHHQKRGSDWIDIIWASYENAFVNAKLYHALLLWADIEKQLGNTIKEKYYNQFSEKLKVSFNKPTTEGGFWDNKNKCYSHWRDKDGSTHGNNMVIPVNFMAIAYGLCDDETRTKTILDDIETQMQKENLFFWPICLYTYAPGEGNDWQFPFPNYENGDIFLSWGAVGVKAYASYKPELALKYVKNILTQYSKDGLAFQRYGRAKQDGLGDDILSGNCLSVIGLYQAIYGINPLYNRFYLDPHITKDLAGTELKYNYRDQKLTIDLDLNRYSVSNGRFKIQSTSDFGFFSSANELFYFDGNTASASLQVITESKSKLVLDIQEWKPDEISWTQSSTEETFNKLIYQINDLKPNNFYTVLINNATFKRLRSDAAGALKFEYKTNKSTEGIRILNK